MLLRPGVATTSPCEVVRCSLSPRPDCDPDANLQATGWGAAKEKREKEKEKEKEKEGPEWLKVTAWELRQAIDPDADPEGDDFNAFTEIHQEVNEEVRRYVQTPRGGGGSERAATCAAGCGARCRGSARGAVLTCDTARARVALVELTANGIPTLWAHPDAKLAAFTLQVLGWKLIQQNSYK